MLPDRLALAWSRPQVPSWSQPAGAFVVPAAGAGACGAGCSDFAGAGAAAGGGVCATTSNGRTINKLSSKAVRIRVITSQVAPRYKRDAWLLRPTLPARPPRDALMKEQERRDEVDTPAAPRGARKDGVSDAQYTQRHYVSRQGYPTVAVRESDAHGGSDCTTDSGGLRQTLGT